MRTTTRFALILLAIATANCGSNTADETTSDVDPVDTGSNGDGNGGSTMPSNGGTDGTDGTDEDAGMPEPMGPPPVTGQEPECLAAFTRVSECYLTQERCTPMAKDSATMLGAALSQTNCAMFAMQAGGLAGLAAQWNATTACDATVVTSVFPSLDMNKTIKGLCETSALTAEECTTSCTNIVPCAAQITIPMAADALGNQMGCETNCNQQPSFATAFRCGIMAGADCAAVAACFEP